MTNLETLLKEMTLEEKAALCTGAGPWTTKPIERLGIPGMIMSDGPHGVRRIPNEYTWEGDALPATCFPTAACLASTWDADLMYTLGQALAKEAIALKVDVLLGPGINMKRSPLGGRNFEYFSEDPFLAGKMASHLVNGIQSLGVGTSLKHFAANNQEYRRFSINAKIDERTLHEIYLAAFETVVKNSKPWTVMCAYNKLNGYYGSENYHLLVEILKKKWGFEGMVISDWGAVHDRVAALAGGLDLEMPGPNDRRVKAVIEAVQNGTLDEGTLDESVRRILATVFKAAQTPKGGTFDQTAHHELARQIASEGMILLKNIGILPLNKPKQLAVIGAAAKQAHFQGGGSSHINPTIVSEPLAAIKHFADGAVITYCEGYTEKENYDQVLIDEAVNQARSAEVALIYIALPLEKDSEGIDRSDLDLTVQQIALIQAVCAVQPNTVVILNNGAPIVMGEWINAPAAILEAWTMGQAGGDAIAEILFGKVNPSGKLAETFPRKLSDTPAFVNWPGSHREVNYGEGIFIGYRYYDTKDIPVQFPFGYGLSYTSFAYNNARLSATSIKDTEKVAVLIDVTNTGKMAGKEIVQVYVHDKKSVLIRPQKELKGFAKVALEPGETKSVSIPLDFSSFAYYHPDHDRWITESGEFEILVGTSSRNIHARLGLTLESTLQLPSTLDISSTIFD
ncbi:MAG TPA: glycoside hydrolase family 3 C-terminal domain-containing protein, partial [Longilinea sp.]|nr:glycoside hydrolase family 3 C-terminal domain-containing protein [Longilinea sp.]